MAQPGTEKTDQASGTKSPPAAGAANPATPSPPPSKAAAPRRRGGGLLGKLFLSALLLLIVLGVAGYGALILRNADPRVGVAADYVDEGLAEARQALDKAQSIIAGLTGQQAEPTAPPRQALLDKAPAPAEAPPSAPAESAKEPERPAEAANPAPEARREAAAPEAAPAPETKPAETKPVETKPVEMEPQVRQGEAKPAETTPHSLAVPAAGAAVDADGFSDRDLISALEGRMDALGDEVGALRARLESPKNETRAAPEAQAAKTAAPPAASPDSGAAAVVLAFALQRDLDAGRPFADEIAAFSRLGTDLAPSPALIELSDKGAPTGAQLRETFLPIAGRLKAHEPHGEAAHEGAPITEHLLQGASKLVKVRPTGEAAPESLDGRIERIEAALARNDYAGAEALFDSLPQEARTEARDFGASLHQRNEAARAADELLHGAIAALGAK